MYSQKSGWYQGWVLPKRVNCHCRVWRRSDYETMFCVVRREKWLSENWSGDRLDTPQLRFILPPPQTRQRLATPWEITWRQSRKSTLIVSLKVYIGVNFWDCIQEFPMDRCVSGESEKEEEWITIVACPINKHLEFSLSIKIFLELLTTDLDPSLFGDS